MNRSTKAWQTLLVVLTLSGCQTRAPAVTTSSDSIANSSSNTSQANSQEVTVKEWNKPKPSAEVLKSKLTPLQYEVTQNAATEPPFRNMFWDNHAAGIYVDVVTGEPLFSSLDKFESGTGWPSFSTPIEQGHVVEHADHQYGMRRVEVVSQSGASHLGHVFDDGPAPTGKRYCINSASLRFIAADKLQAEGYGEYATRFSGGAKAHRAEADQDLTNNSCTKPAPGQKAGCETTLETAVVTGGFAGLEEVARKIPGVLEIDSDSNAKAVRIVFDPAKLTYADLQASLQKQPAGKQLHFSKE